MDQTEKVLENRLRRMARRQGLAIVKSRLRDGRALGYGGYMIVDASTNMVEAGGHPWAFSLNVDEVEKYLAQGKRRVRKKR